MDEGSSFAFALQASARDRGRAREAKAAGSSPAGRRRRYHAGVQSWLSYLKETLSLVR